MLNRIASLEDIKENEILDFDDDMAVLYAALYSHPDLAAMLNDNLPYIKESQMGDALFYAAMGDREALMKIIGSEQSDLKSIVDGSLPCAELSVQEEQR